MPSLSCLAYANCIPGCITLFLTGFEGWGAGPVEYCLKVKSQLCKQTLALSPRVHAFQLSKKPQATYTTSFLPHFFGIYFLLIDDHVFFFYLWPTDLNYQKILPRRLWTSLCTDSGLGLFPQKIGAARLAFEFFSPTAAIPYISPH